MVGLSKSNEACHFQRHYSVDDAAQPATTLMTFTDQSQEEPQILDQAICASADGSKA